MQYSALIASFFAILAFTCAQDDITFKNVNRNIDLNSQFAKHTVSITVENTGSKSASSFVFGVEQNLADHASFVSAQDSTGSQLKVTPGKAIDGKKTSYIPYTIELKNPLEKGATSDITVKAVFTHVMTPYPTSIAQNEKQFVRYADNVYLFSPYKVSSQTTTVKLASANIESKTEKAPTSVKGDTITYGPYADVEAFSRHDLNVHFENTKPFLTVEKVVRELEISHWGNLAVEESYEVLKHDGAKLKGTFSRYDFQRNPSGAPAAITVFREYLPAGAADIYYRDEIGNISTSTVNEHARGIALDIVPRFPLFGGWKTSYYLGYNLPLSQALFTDVNDGRYVLNFTFGVGLDDVVIEELVVRIILPEGAKNIEHYTPFTLDSTGSSVHFTYLDTTGRPVLILTKKNVVVELNQRFQVLYNFSSVSLWNEPFLLIAAYFAFFLFVMFYARLNFNIGPVKERSSNTEKAEELLTKIRDFFEQRSEAHSSLDSALAKFKTEKQYNEDRKKAEFNLNLLKKEVQKALSEAEGLSVDLSRQVRDLEIKEEKKLQYQLQLHDNEIKYRVQKIISKDVYEEQKSQLEKSYSAADEDVENSLADLTE